MSNPFHILNGDALLNQFPSLPGERIIARECLVDGPVDGATIPELLKTRAQFISQNYAGYSEADYYQRVAPEIEKIMQLPAGVTVNLWFEDDLFCQVNCWFILYLLEQQASDFQVYLVRPPVHTRYGFALFNSAELQQLYQQKIALKSIEQLAQLWTYYQQNNQEALLTVAQQFEADYPFILRAVNAHLDRIPKVGFLGRPKQILLDLQQDLGTADFGAIFRAFCERAPIYGFGDLQVRHLLQELESA
jgi:hypothetical protein